MQGLELENAVLRSARLAQDLFARGAVSSIVANTTIPDSGPVSWAFDAGATARNITLPTAAEGKVLLLGNIASSTAVLSILNAAGTTILTMSPASIGLMICLNGIWYGMSVPEALSGAELAFLDGVTAGTTASSKVVVPDASKNVDELGITTTARIGTATTSKVSIWGATATTQPSGTNQAAVASTAVTGPSATVATSSTAFGFVTSTQADALVNAVRSLTNLVNSLTVWQNQVRTDLISAGIIKGSN